jgi:hypothetical protein
MTTDICKKDDYSNTIIYKITCKDPNIKDIYVGHTINFVQRKSSHKQNCINSKSPNYKCKLYETIRSNGGWSNWKMEIIHFFSCGGLYEAKKVEQEYFTLLNANLNSVEPCGKGKSKNKKKKEKATPNIQKILSDKYYCEKCGYETNRKNNMTTHLSSAKHQKLTTYNIKSSDNNKQTATLSKYCCQVCDKKYNDRAGLWRHKQKCINVSKKPDEQSLVLEILKQNQEYQKLLLLQQQQILELTAKSFGNILNN